MIARKMFKHTPPKIAKLLGHRQLVRNPDRNVKLIVYWAYLGYTDLPSWQLSNAMVHARFATESVASIFHSAAQKPGVNHAVARQEPRKFTEAIVTQGMICCTSVHFRQSRVKSRCAYTKSLMS